MKTQEKLKDEDGFRMWLLESRSISRRVSSNYISRCKRVQKELSIDLNNSVRGENKFIDIMIKIQEFAIKKADSKEAAYNLAGSLRLAVKRYAEYICAQKARNYPSNYKLTKYD